MVHHLIRMQETATKDPDYVCLLGEYRELDSRLLTLMETLPPADAALIEDYLGVLGELHRRQLFILCKMK